MTPSPAAINFQKLDHFNGTHIRLLSTEDLAARIKPYLTGAGLDVPNETLLKITPLIRERLVTLDDSLEFASFFFKENVEPEPEDLVAKGLDAKQSAQIARTSYEILASLPDISHQVAEPPMREYVERSGFERWPGIWHHPRGSDRDKRSARRCSRAWKSLDVRRCSNGCRRQ